jgi:hypothetical protein
MVGGDAYPHGGLDGRCQQLQLVGKRLVEDSRLDRSVWGKPGVLDAGFFVGD